MVQEREEKPVRGASPSTVAIVNEDNSSNPWWPLEEEEEEDVLVEYPLTPMQSLEITRAVDFFVSQPESYKFDSKWAIKNMTTTFCGVEDGSVDLSCLFERFGSELNFVLPTGNMDVEMNAVERDARHIAIKVLHERFAPRSRYPNDERLTFSKEFHHFVLSLLGNIVQLLEMSRGRGPETHMEWMRLYRTATNATCRAQASRLEEAFFRGQQGTFLRNSPMVGMPATYFSAVLGAKPRDAQSTIERHYMRQRRDQAILVFRQLFGAVASGLYRSEQTCSHCCSKVSGPAFSVCSGCHLAVYCGRQCQRTDWKEVHKVQCATLSAKHEHLQQSLVYLTAKHDDEIQQGRTPNFGADYWALHHCTLGRDSSPWQGTELEDALQPPSLEFYFANLCRVRAWALWFFPKNKTPNKCKPRLRDAASNAEMKVFHRLVEFLCYDYRKDMEDVTAFTYPPLSEIDGNNLLVGMTAERFLEILDVTGARGYQTSANERIAASRPNET
ncbi:expressed unknown protein [Seminavis robusta]|uniref:MYND-type domain-containing protein n=1 Tax=Seminavis robusta TaxID=568900 RepID=A0A9N8DMU5_9STRA|nr:expressed unknown protein [Seminavis robusta]|eukprot:Sro214_g088720.1 n/a (500) ;mRNA; f:32609-34108